MVFLRAVVGVNCGGMPHEDWVMCPITINLLGCVPLRPQGLDRHIDELGDPFADLRDSVMPVDDTGDTGAIRDAELPSDFRVGQPSAKQDEPHTIAAGKRQTLVARHVAVSVALRVSLTVAHLVAGHASCMY